MPRWSSTCGAANVGISSTASSSRSIKAPPQAGHQSAMVSSASTAWQWLQIRSISPDYRIAPPGFGPKPAFDRPWPSPYSPSLNKFFLFKRLFVCKRGIALYNSDEETHGRRYSITVQRLRAGLYLHRCGSDVLSGTWLFDPKTLQELPSGKEERSGGVRLPFGSGTGNTCDLFGLRPAYNSAF